MNLDTIEQRALAAGFSTTRYGNSISVSHSDDADSPVYAVRYFTVPGTATSRLRFVDADTVPADMLALLARD